MKYTREDVIIWPDDERLKDAIGKEVYVGVSEYDVMSCANKNFASSPLQAILVDSTKPFVAFSGRCYSHIIFKKAPKKTKRVPFDFSLKEDRDAVMGKRIYNEKEDIVVTAFANIGGKWVLEGNTETGEDVLSHWFFADTCKPVGKEVEV